MLAFAFYWYSQRGYRSDFRAASRRNQSHYQIYIYILLPFASSRSTWQTGFKSVLLPEQQLNLKELNW